MRAHQQNRQATQATKAHHFRADYLTIIPGVRVGYEMVADKACSAKLAIIILYQPSASGIIVLLKTSAKYREFFPTLFVKTTNSAFFKILSRREQLPYLEGMVKWLIYLDG